MCGSTNYKKEVLGQQTIYKKGLVCIVELNWIENNLFTKKKTMDEDDLNSKANKRDSHHHHKKKKKKLNTKKKKNRWK